MRELGRTLFAGEVVKIGIMEGVGVANVACEWRWGRISLNKASLACLVNNKSKLESAAYTEDLRNLISRFHQLMLTTAQSSLIWNNALQTQSLLMSALLR